MVSGLFLMTNRNPLELWKRFDLFTMDVLIEFFHEHRVCLSDIVTGGYQRYPKRKHSITNLLGKQLNEQRCHDTDDDAV